MAPLRAVTFDCWQTLILDRPDGLARARAGRIQGIHDLVAAQGICVDRSAVERAYDAVGERLETVWKTQRDIGSRGQVRILLEQLGLDGVVPPDGALMEALEGAYCLPILSALPVANVGAPEVLAGLAGRGLRLGLVCNTGRTSGRMLRIVLERLGLARHLAVLTFSDEVGLRKPHAEIFNRTLAGLGATPAVAVHVGDDTSSDVAGAQALGMHAVHLCHAEGASQDSRGAPSVASLSELLALLDRLEAQA